MRVSLSLDLLDLIRRQFGTTRAFFNKHVTPTGISYFKFQQMVNGERRPAEEVTQIENICIELGFWGTDEARALGGLDIDKLRMTARRLHALIKDGLNTGFTYHRLHRLATLNDELEELL
jgi:hypothetical protein